MEVGGAGALKQGLGRVMKKSTKYILIFFIGAFVFVLAYNPDFEKNCQKILKREKKMEVIGIVVKKYYVNQYMYPYLEIKLCSDSSTVKKSYYSELSGIFDYAEVGDSIFKHEGSLNYSIVRDSVVKEFKFTMFCNE